MLEFFREIVRRIIVIRGLGFRKKYRNKIKYIRSGMEAVGNKFVRVDFK